MEDMVNVQNLEDAQRFVAVYENLSDDDKTKAMVYISALRDKEVADSERKI